jgi:hypothetical protein
MKNDVKTDIKVPNPNLTATQQKTYPKPSINPQDKQVWVPSGQKQ